MMRRYWCGGKKDFPKKAKIGDFEKENFTYMCISKRNGSYIKSIFS
jgi:hypothetical protein